MSQQGETNLPDQFKRMNDKNYDPNVEEETTQTPEEEAEDTSDNEQENAEQESEGVSEEDTQEEENEEVDWKERALKAEKAIEKSKKKQKTKPKEESGEDLTIARLEARGILNAEDQSYVLKYAKVEGLSPIEALEDSFVKDRLAHNEKQRKSAQAAPRGNNRAGQQQDDLSADIKKYKANGSIPSEPGRASKLLDALKNGA